MKLEDFFEKIEEVKKVDERTYDRIINFLEGVLFAQEKRVKNEGQDNYKRDFK